MSASSLYHFIILISRATQPFRDPPLRQVSSHFLRLTLSYFASSLFHSFHIPPNSLLSLLTYYPRFLRLILHSLPREGTRERILHHLSHRASALFSHAFH